VKTAPDDVERKKKNAETAGAKALDVAEGCFRVVKALAAPGMTLRQAAERGDAEAINAIAGTP
jgi:hypothetical protein